MRLQAEYAEEIQRKEREREEHARMAANLAEMWTQEEQRAEEEERRVRIERERIAREEAERRAEEERRKNMTECVVCSEEGIRNAMCMLACGHGYCGGCIARKCISSFCIHQRHVSSWKS